MKDYNTKNENDNNEDENTSEEDESNNKVGGFYRGFYLHGQNKGGYAMGLEQYESRIRKKIIKLKSEKKNATDDEHKESIEREILFLKTRLLNNTDNAIYNYLTNRVSKHNVVNMNRVEKTQKAIAEKLGLNTTVVSTSFKKLRELHVIDFEKQGNNFHKIFISPRILWKKDVNFHRKVIWDLDNLGGNSNFRRDPFEVDPDYLKPPKKKKAA